MRVFISADMEGVSSVTGWPDVTPGSPDYARACRWMTQDVNAAIQGAVEAGADTVLVNDGHWRSRNILPEELDRHAELIRGYVKPLGMMEGIDRGWDAAFFIGYHAGFGPRDGLMGHTLSHECFRDVRLNGRSVTEAELNAATAGSYGVPAVLFSGDRALEREVQAFLPTARTAVVKDGLEHETAVLLHPDTARQRIREAARLALERGVDVPPYRVAGPCVVEAEFQRAGVATLAACIPTVDRAGDFTVRFEAPGVPEAARILKVLLKLGA